MRTPERGRRRKLPSSPPDSPPQSRRPSAVSKSEEVDLALDTTDDADRLTEIGLRMPRRMHQRDEHLLRSLPPAGHVILHDRDPTREAVLISQPLENPLRRMLLLLRP